MWELQSNLILKEAAKSTEGITRSSVNYLHKRKSDSALPSRRSFCKVDSPNNWKLMFKKYTSCVTYYLSCFYNGIIRDLLCSKMNENTFVDSFFFCCHLFFSLFFFSVCIFVFQLIRCIVKPLIATSTYILLKENLKIVFWVPEAGCPK